MTTPTLRAYLDTKFTTAADWNVTGMGGGWTGKFKIPEEEYDLYLDLHHDHVFNRGRACSLLEKHKKQSPILIDLDFRYAAGGPLRRRFTDEQVREFVAAYADAITRFFGPLPDNKSLQFFVMLKPAPEADAARDNHKDGVHIVCPSLTTGPEFQYAIRGYLLQTGVIERIFGSTGMTNGAQDCLDLSVVQRNNWFLYGACKPDKAWYKVEHVYSVTIPEVYDEVTADSLEEETLDTWTTAELVKLLSIRRGHDTETTLALRTEDAVKEGEWLQLLQRWGKGSNWAKVRTPSLTAKTESTEPPPLSLDSTATAAADADAMVQISGISVRAGYSTEDIALAYKLMRECVNPTKRAKDYHGWVNTGMMLHNIAPTEESCKVWAEFSRRVPGCSSTPESTYKDKWALLPAEASALQRGRKPLMMGTLHLWAKEDSPSAYKSILQDANTDIAYLNDTGSHVAVADLVVRMYRHEFRCTPPRKGANAASMDWYQFAPDGHTWKSLKTWMRLRERLSNEVRNIYIEADVRAGRREMATTDMSEKERLQAKRKNLLKVEASLQSTGFKDNVMKESAEKFYDEDFLQHMNQDATLVGFSNGVLELRHINADGEPHICFRPGRPDDCISFQMGRGMVGLDAIPYIHYDPTAATQAPEYAEIIDFFTKIYPDAVLREYVLTLLSACLEGANREQKFYIMTGGGSNGKSKLVDLMSKTMGEYQETLGTTAITRKRPESGAANPDLVVLKCKRFVSMVEPDEGEKINTASMKQLAGEDMVKARALFQDQDCFVIMARMFMCCNDMPPVSSTDNGTWRRLRVIPHVSKFVDPGMPTDPATHIYTKDLLLESKINRWRPYFASLLAWYYENKYLRGGLKEPAQVTAASMKYKEENDSFASFCQDCILKEAGAETRANDILVRYKDWCKYNPGKKVLPKPAVLLKLTELYGAPIDGAGKIYAGIRIAEEGEDISGNVILHM